MKSPEHLAKRPDQSPKPITPRLETTLDQSPNRQHTSFAKDLNPNTNSHDLNNHGHAIPPFLHTVPGGTSCSGCNPLTPQTLNFVPPSTTHIIPLVQIV